MVESRSGVWWTDADPSRRVSGTLARVDGKWQLDVLGVLPVSHEHSVDGLSLVPPTTIYGSCKRVRYTLKHCYLMKSSGFTFGRAKHQDSKNWDDGQNSESWMGFTLFSGEALSENALFKSASFEVTGLSDWWPYSGLSDSFDDYSHPTASEAGFGGGFKISVVAGTTESFSYRRKSIAEFVSIRIDRASGFTYDELTDQIIAPLRCLFSIAMSDRVEDFNCNLWPLLEDDSDSSDGHLGYAVKVDPEVFETSSLSGDRHYLPLFTIKDIDFGSFLPKWMNLAKGNPVPFAVAEDRDTSGSLQMKVVEVVNAAETLHRALYESTTAYPFANRVAEQLLNTDLKSAERRKVKKAVEFTEFTLKDRLLELAGGLGDDFCSWLFQGELNSWANISAVVRNALSHGYETNHAMEKDHGVMIGILRATQAVIKLRMLVECGFPTGRELITLASRSCGYGSLSRQTVVDWNGLADRLKLQS